MVMVGGEEGQGLVCWVKRGGRLEDRGEWVKRGPDLIISQQKV